MTSAVLLTVFLPVTFYASMRIFGALIAFMLTLAAWEWARLLKLKNILSIIYALTIGSVLFVGTLGLDQAAARGVPIIAAGLTKPTYLYQGLAVFWLCIVPLLLMRQPKLTAGVWRGFLLVVGMMLFLSCWQALMTARMIGITFILSVLLIVWSADTGAYFVGRQLGTHKLAPSISPAKTWEGAIGGWLLTMLMFGAILAIAPRAFTPTLFSAYAGSMGWLGALAIITSLVALCVTGDLFESLMKRQAGVKDSSALLPGHGGVLDRIDGMMAVLPMAMLFVAVGGKITTPHCVSMI